MILLHFVHYGSKFYEEYIEIKYGTRYIGYGGSVRRSKQPNRKKYYAKYMNAYEKTYMVQIIINLIK